MRHQLTTLASLLLVVISVGSKAETQVVIKTNLGDVGVTLNEEAAPISVANFLRYVDDDSFNDTIFHRVIPGFMVQGGGQYLDMSEAPEGEPIFNEAENGLKNDFGTISMARMNEIDSAGRQFFINVADNDFLNHSRKSCSREDEVKTAKQRAQGRYKPQTCKSFGYAVFGKVDSGMDIIELIEDSDTHSVGAYSDVPVNPITIVSVERVEAD